jgi:hypothetical protein
LVLKVTIEQFNGIFAIFIMRTSAFDNLFWWARSPSDLSESSGMIPDFGSVSHKKRSATKMIGE